ncbi:MAG: RNase J family beta-CASP ribonuclease [Candidatus Nanoarchaeia archaeon]|jgi:ribonuclease J|nr:RNase J family beta-CASP ribonuclease [Candidatus Nanoarchaeia archaeon]|tara:strand:- start:46247 stop:47572 length:1326 start_codon:yes stop_codon:yes gene_type:complete
MEFFSVGGYSEVGKNMSAVKIGNDIIILDMGVFLPAIIDFEEQGGERKNLTTEGLIKLGAIPNDNILNKHKDKVKAIVLGHCHLDHIGAVPYLAPHYDAPIIGSQYTLEVLKSELQNERVNLKNKLIKMNPNSTYKVNNIELEFIHVTHSTLQTSLVALHTKEGTILYANDFKFDNNPVIEKKPNFQRLKQIGKGNVKALIVESLYAHQDGKTPSEKVAREMLKDVMLGVENTGNAIITTSFASHIARLKSMAEFGQKLNRKVVFLGRSMNKYIKAAEAVKLINFSKSCDVVGYGAQVKRKLAEIEKQGRDNYLIVCTGGQGEPNSILTRLATKQLPFNFMKDDHVIFSNRTIPAEINLKNRGELERNLKNQHVRVFKDVHSSGHAYREDLRDLINMIKPQNIIPAHGPSEKLNNLASLAFDIGYSKKEVKIMSNGKSVVV